MKYKTADGVRELVAERVRERADLDFKRELPSKEKNADLAKDLSAMANAGGGVIIVGIEERAGRAETLRPFGLAGAAERVAAIARDRIDEALPLAEVLDVITEPDDSGVLVIQVEQGDRVPYFVDGQAWGRSGPKNVPLTRAEVGRLFAMHGTGFLEEFGVSIRRPAAVRARIEKERIQKSVDAKGKIKYDTRVRLVLENVGDEDALDVDFEFLKDETDPGVSAPEVIRDGPIKHLLARREVSYPLLVYGGMKPSPEIRLAWHDNDGQPHAIEQTLSL
jgi:hypothetical protein